MNVFLSLDIGHFTISSQKKIDYTDFSFFLLLFSYFVLLQEFRCSKVAANKLYVTLRIADGAQTGFAFFAVTLEDLCSHSCRGPTVTGVFPSRHNMQNGDVGENLNLKNTAEKWFLSGRLVCMARPI